MTTTIVEYTPVWVVMTDAWTVIGPFKTEDEAQNFSALSGGDVVAMMPPDAYLNGLEELCDD